MQGGLRELWPAGAMLGRPRRVVQWQTDRSECTGSQAHIWPAQEGQQQQWRQQQEPCSIPWTTQQRQHIASISGQASLQRCLWMGGTAQLSSSKAVTASTRDSSGHHSSWVICSHSHQLPSGWSAPVLLFWQRLLSWFITVRASFLQQQQLHAHCGAQVQAWSCQLVATMTAHVCEQACVACRCTAGSLPVCSMSVTSGLRQLKFSCSRAVTAESLCGRQPPLLCCPDFVSLRV